MPIVVYLVIVVLFIIIKMLVVVSKTIIIIVFIIYFYYLLQLHNLSNSLIDSTTSMFKLHKNLVLLLKFSSLIKILFFLE